MVYHCPVPDGLPLFSSFSLNSLTRNSNEPLICIRYLVSFRCLCCPCCLPQVPQGAAGATWTLFRTAPTERCPSRTTRPSPPTVLGKFSCYYPPPPWLLFHKRLTLRSCRLDYVGPADFVHRVAKKVLKCPFSLLVGCAYLTLPQVRHVTLLDHHKTAFELMEQWKAENSLPQNCTSPLP